MRVKYLVAILAAVMVLALGHAGFAQTTNPDTFVFVAFGEPDSFDPAYAYDTSSGEIIHQCYDNLMAYEKGSIEKMVPMLATKVPSVANGLISKDGRTVKFPIRSGVKFHDGSVLTPEDVEYSFERAMLADPAGGPVWMFFEPLFGIQTLKDLACKVGGLDKVDDMTKLDPAVLRKVYEAVDKAVEVEGDSVVFRLATPYPPFLQILAKGASWGAIINKKWMVAHGAWDGKPDTWIKWYDPPKEEMTLYDTAMGTGPFRLSKWDKSGGQIIFERFDGYWRGPAKLKSVFIKYIDEYNTRKLMLQTGEADAIMVPAMYLDQIRTIPGVVVEDHLPAITNTTLLFNYTIPVKGNEDVVGSGKLDGKGVPPNFFNDVHVRRAFNYAFDYDVYINEVALGQGSKPHGPVPAILPYCDKKQEWYPHDLKKAADEFKAAFGGELWNKGFKLTILYNTGNDNRKTAAEILESNIERVNSKFKVDVQGVQWATYLDKLRASALPVFFMGWHMDFPDAHNFVFPYMHSAGAFAGYCGEDMIKLAREEFDELIAKGISTTDQAARVKIYEALQRKAYAQAVALFYVDAQDQRIHRDWVKGFVFNPAYSANYDFYEVWKEAK
ncbi:MAG: ABC transporter substrate-binding protein [Bacteroidota bacterium]